MRKQHIFVLQKRHFITSRVTSTMLQNCACEKKVLCRKTSNACICCVSVAWMLAAKMMGNPSLREIAKRELP
jgi:hypothetical protein